MKTKKYFDLLFVLYWLYTGVGFYVEQLFYSVIGKEIISPFLTFFYVVTFIFLVFASSNYLLSRFDARLLIVLIIVFVAILFSYISFEANRPFIERNFSTIPTVLLGLFLGFNLNPDKALNSKIKKASIFVIVINLIHYIRTAIFMGISYSGNSMYYVSVVLPSFLFLISTYCISRKKTQLFLIIFVSLTYSLLLGSRGGIVCSLAILLLAKLSTIETREGIIKFLVLVLLLIGVVVLIWKPVLQLISVLIRSFNGSTRVIEMLIDGDFISDSNRNNLINDAMGALLVKSPIFGLGLFGDRVLYGAYVHNVAVELLIDFGLVFGIICLFVIVKLSFNNLFKTLPDTIPLFLCIFGMGFLKLLASGTYIDSIFFWMLIGYISRKIDYKRKKMCLSQIKS